MVAVMLLLSGAALSGAIKKFKDKAKVDGGAYARSSNVEDIEYENGELYVKGSPDNAKTIQECCLHE